MANYLSGALGGSTAQHFSASGVTQAFILPWSDLRGKFTAVAGTDAPGTTVAISAINLAGAQDAKFIELAFVENSANYTDIFKPSNTRKYMEQTFTCAIDADGASTTDKAHKIMLTRKVCFLVQRKNGLWYLLGLSDGLKPADSNANSGQQAADDSGLTLSFTGINLGLAPQVTMSDADIEAVVVRA